MVSLKKQPQESNSNHNVSKTPLQKNGTRPSIGYTMTLLSPLPQLPCSRKLLYELPVLMYLMGFKQNVLWLTAGRHDLWLHLAARHGLNMVRMLLKHLFSLGASYARGLQYQTFRWRVRVGNLLLRSG